MAIREKAITEQRRDNGRKPGLFERLGLRRHKCDDLLPSRQVLEKLALEEQRNLGLQRVKLDKIVGSSGRYRDFDLSFEPRDTVSRDRWQRVASIFGRQQRIPPILLYKVGDRYLVEDGNHRISVARSRGQETIEAMVVELDPSPLTADPACTRLGYKV